MPDEPDIESPDREQRDEESYRILILDNPENVRRMKDACKKAGHEAVPVHTIEEAFDFLHGTDKADVIVCAAHMEHESMMEFVSQVRADEKHEDAAVIMLALEPGEAATRISTSTERAGKVLGADAYITMPRFDAAKLIDEIETHLSDIPHREQAKRDS